jgi:sigma-B regulation protein RsbU (phosphoserine phosphatase)
MDRALAAAPARPADPTADLRLAHQRLAQAYRQIDADLEAAQRVQRSFQPRRLPELAGVRCAAYFRPCGAAGGDCYGAFQLDEHQMGFYLATVVGRGVAAALLAVCLGKLQMLAQADGVREPAETLQRLNRELLELALPDAPFVTAVYGVLDGHDGTLRLARAGHPQPILLPRDGPARALGAEGNMLGVLPTHCSAQTCCLDAGDRLLLYSDGLAPRCGSNAALERLLVAALEHRALPIQEHVERTAQALAGHGSVTDDATLLAVERYGRPIPAVATCG